MMWCGVITVFPQMFSALADYGITGRAIESGLLSWRVWNLRDYADNKHATVDDRPYGGGPGMVMMAQPLQAALTAAKAAAPSQARVIYVTPAGKRFDQQKARELAQSQQPLIFIAGRYEGIDQRIVTQEVDEQLSLGDYVISGGELAIMVMVDALTRWLPGALGHEQSASQDAFAPENLGLLDCPHYTRPAVWGGEAVPNVLLAGDHQAIARWRKKQSLGQTWLYRPDLLPQELDALSQCLLTEFQQEYRKEKQS